MKKTFNHVLSLLVFGFFILAGISSDILTNPVPSCDELKAKHEALGYYPCSPLVPDITRENEFKFKVLDKLTGEPIPNIRVLITGSTNYLEKKEVDNCDECFGTLEVNKYEAITILLTDSNGEVKGKTRPLVYLDKRDVQVMTFHFSATENKYAEKYDFLRFDYQSEKLEKTIYLLDNSL